MYILQDNFPSDLFPDAIASADIIAKPSNLVLTTEAFEIDSSATTDDIIYSQEHLPFLHEVAKQLDNDNDKLVALVGDYESALALLRHLDMKPEYTLVPLCFNCPATYTNCFSE